MQPIKMLQKVMDQLWPQLVKLLPKSVEQQQQCAHQQLHEHGELAVLALQNIAVATSIELDSTQNY